MVALEISAHSLTVREEQPGRDRVPVVFQTYQVKVQLKDNRLSLTQGKLQWSRPFPGSAEGGIF